MHRNQYTKVNDKKVLHKVKKQWVVISSAILMAMSGGMIVNHVTHKPMSTIDKIKSQASGLHNRLLQSNLWANADATSNQPINARNITSNVQSANDPQRNNSNGLGSVIIETPRGPVAVSNTPYNVQIARQQQINAQNTATSGNTAYQSNGSADAQNTPNNVQSTNPSTNQQPINNSNNGQGSVTINTTRGPVAVSNTPYNVQIAKQQQAASASAQNTLTSASSASLSGKSNKPVNSSTSVNPSSSSQQSVQQSADRNNEKQNHPASSSTATSVKRPRMNLRSTPPKRQLSEDKSSQHIPIRYRDRHGHKHDIAPGAKYSYYDNNSGKEISGTIHSDNKMYFKNNYVVGNNIIVHKDTLPLPYTLNGNDNLFSRYPIYNNWQLGQISDGLMHTLLPNPNDDIQKNFYYEKPDYRFANLVGTTNKSDMYLFSPNFITSGGHKIQVPSQQKLNGSGVSNPIHLSLHIVPKQDIVKFNGLVAGTQVNGHTISDNVGDDFNSDYPGLAITDPSDGIFDTAKISAPVGHHFVTNANHNFTLHNYVPNSGSDYRYGQSDNYSGSDGYNQSKNNYYFKYFNIGTVDGSFITLNVKPDTANAIYMYNGNRVDLNYSDKHTYNDKKTYNTDRNGNPIADAITFNHHPGLPASYHLVNSSTSIPFNNMTTDVPVEPNTFDFNYIDDQNHQIKGTSRHHYAQPNEPLVSDIVNDIHNDVPKGFVLVGGQTKGLKYDNNYHHFIVVPASNLRKTVTRTIHYENHNKLPPHDIYSTVSQPITYDRTAMINRGSASYSPFTYSAGTGTWSAVPTPNLSSLGYRSAEAPYAQSVSSSSTPNGDQASNCSVTVEYPDDSVIATPDKPGNPGSKIPDGSSTWPDGSRRSDLTRTITRTIEYRNQNGGPLMVSSSAVQDVVQNVTYNRSMTVDKVTGQHSTSPWYAQGNVWSQVNSPSMSNYGYGTPRVYSDTEPNPQRNAVANSVSSSNVGVSDHNQTIDIRYPDVQTVVNPLQPSTAQILGHRINLDGLVNNITRTVNYINSRGQALVTPSRRQTVTYYQKETVDHVTGQIVNKFPWAAAKGITSWQEITSPDMSKKGYGTPYTYEKNSTLIPQNQRTKDVLEKNIPSSYTAANDETIDVLYPDTTTVVTPDSAKVPGDKINSDSNVVWPAGTDKNSLIRPITRTIHYVNERGQKIAPSDTQTVTFYHTVTVDNATGEPISFTRWLIYNKPDNTRHVLLGAPSPDLGQQENGDSGTTGSNDSNVWSAVISPNLSARGYGKPNKPSVARQVVEATSPNVNVTVTYPDAQSSNLEKPKTITRTIHYKDKLTQQEVASPVTQQVTYNHVINRDDATGKVISDWQTNNNTWSDVPSPNLTVEGYSAPSINNVPATRVDHNDGNQNLIVTYNPGTIIIYPNGIDNDLSQTTTQTINYVGPDGKEIPGVKSNKQTIYFTRTAEEDRVTGQILSYSKWHPNKGYTDVKSPNETSRGYICPPNQQMINGYTPKDPMIGNTTITIQYQRAKPAPVPNSGNKKPNSNVPASGSSAQPTPTPRPANSGSNRPKPNVPSSSSSWHPTPGPASGGNQPGSNGSNSSSSWKPTPRPASSGSNQPGPHIPGSNSNSPWRPIPRPSGGNSGSGSKAPSSSSSWHPTPAPSSGGNTPNPNVPGSSSSWWPTPSSASNGNRPGPNVPGSSSSWRPTPGPASGGNRVGPNSSSSSSSWHPTPAPSSGGNQPGSNVPGSSSSWRPTPSSTSNGNRPGPNVPGSNSSWRPMPGHTNGGNTPNSNVPGSNSSWWPTSGSAGSNQPEPNVPTSGSSWRPTPEPNNGSNVPESNGQTPNSANNGGYIPKPNVPRSNSSWHPTPWSNNGNGSNQPRFNVPTSGSTIRPEYVPFNNKIHYASTAGEFIQPGASQSSSSSSDYSHNEMLSNLGFKPLRRSTPMFSRPTKSMHYDNSYPFVKLNTGRHTTPKRENRHLPQTGENHNYSGLFGSIMTLMATLIAALGKGFDRRHNK